MKKRRIMAALVAFLCIFPVLCFAHSGRTDANGGHYNRKTGEYHYHNGGSSKSTKTTKKTVKPVMVITGASSQMLVGEDAALACTVDGVLGTITWSSSNQKVARVTAAGILQACGKGTATIKASYGSNSKTFKVTVKPVLITSIALEETHIVLEKGQTLTLYPVILPKNASDQSLNLKPTSAKVVKAGANGEITGLSIGQSKITVSAKDGSKQKTIVEVLVLAPLSEIAFPITKDSDKEAIKSLQALLAANGFYKGTIDGKFQNKLENAVSAAQEAFGFEKGDGGKAFYTALIDEYE